MTDSEGPPSLGGDDPYATCAECGSDLAGGEWHPVEIEHDDDGVSAVYSFCDDECRAGWLEIRENG